MAYFLRDVVVDPHFRSVAEKRLTLEREKVEDCLLWNHAENLELAEILGTLFQVQVVHEVGLEVIEIEVDVNIDSFFWVGGRFVADLEGIEVHAD